MGLNWQHTIWNQDFKNPLDKFVFIYVADRCFDSEKEVSFDLEAVAEYTGITKRKVAEILQSYHQDLIEYVAAKGRNAKTKIKFLIRQRKNTFLRETPVVIEEKVSENSHENSQEKTPITNTITNVNETQPPHTPHKEYIYNTTSYPLQDGCEVLLDAVREVYQVNILHNEKRWIEQIDLAVRNGLAVKDVTTALKKLLADKKRKYPVTPENVITLAIESRLNPEENKPPIETPEKTIDEILNPPGLPYIPHFTAENLKTLEREKCLN